MAAIRNNREAVESEPIEPEALKLEAGVSTFPFLVLAAFLILLDLFLYRFFLWSALARQNGSRSWR